MSVSSSINSLVGQRIVVSVGDLAVLGEKNGKISTFGVGTCLGVVMYEPGVGAGGMIHVMLPDSTLSPEKSEARPGMFADTGVPKLMEELEKLGGDRSQIKVFLAGSAEALTKNDVFKIGEKNVGVVKKLLEAAGIGEPLEDLGGRANRTLHFKLETGEVEVKTAGGGTKTISLK